MSIEHQKNVFRQEAKTIRRQALITVPDAAYQIQERLLALPILEQPCVISGFWPLAEELDTLPILHALHHLGHQVLLPIMQGSERPLLFGTWQPGDTLVTAAFGTQEPTHDKPLKTPNIMLAPLLAFDRRGYRMGYGGGFYDRTIAHIKSRQHPNTQPLITIGLACAAQEQVHLITDHYDMPLDYIVTEQATLVCNHLTN